MRKRYRSPVPQASQGFTLVEALLTITIGAILLASGTVMYQQYRQSAGNSSAMDRVMALQSTVESTYAANNEAYPDLNLLSAAWQAKRPNDYTASPWGGFAASAGVPVTAGSLIGGGDSTGHTNSSNLLNAPNAGDSGLLYYWFAPNNGYIGATDQAGGGGTQAYFQNYLVAIVPNNQTTPQYWFVRGGIVTNASGSPSQVGPGSSPSPLF